MLACTHLSMAVGMPRRRSLPDALGIIRSRTGNGTNRPALRLSRSRGRTVSVPKTMSAGFHAIDTGRTCAPDCPAARAHPTVKEGGIADEVEQVTEPTIGAVGRPLVQLGLDPQYPGLGFFERRPWCVGVHRRPPGMPVPSLRTRWVPSLCVNLQ